MIVILLTTINNLVSAQKYCFTEQIFDTLHVSIDYQSLPDTLGTIGQKEISGIVSSIDYPDHIWGINDSGNGAVLYLYSRENAELKALYKLGGLLNIDWEDIAIKGAKNGESFIYIADIGDNKGKRKIYTIYKITEPDYSNSMKKVNSLILDPEAIKYTYANGSRDAEAIAYDPVEKTLIIISKREKNVFVYSLELDVSSQGIQTLEPIGQLPLSNVVAADISSDGINFMVKTYTNIYQWKRTNQNEPICELLSRVPKKINYQMEPQGESACFVDDGFLTVSEERFGIKPILFHYRQKHTKSN